MIATDMRSFRQNVLEKSVIRTNEGKQSRWTDGHSWSRTSCDRTGGRLTEVTSQVPESDSYPCWVWREEVDCG